MYGRKLSHPSPWRGGKPKDAAKLFSVPDFVGDACKAIASRIRGAVAGVQFDDFHKVQIISNLSFSWHQLNCIDYTLLR